jgi:hypothetical protein
MAGSTTETRMPAEITDAALAYLKERAGVDGVGEFWHSELEKGINADLTKTVRSVRKLVADKKLTYAHYSEGWFSYQVAAVTT